MKLYIITGLFLINSYPLHIKKIPTPFVKFLRENVELKNKLTLNEISWEKTNNLKSIKNRYFNSEDLDLINQYNNYNNYNYGEMFKIYGVPAALFVITEKKNKKYVDQIIYNKNLILMFDAGDIMRDSFNNFDYIITNKSINKNIFQVI